MKKRVFVIFLCVVLATALFPVEKIILKDGIDFAEKLVANDVFLKMCKDFDWDERYMYLLERKYCKIFQVDIHTGKLIRTISSRGQGPGELSVPWAIEVKDEKIFVVDKGFRGVKIFGSDGRAINEFKTKTSFRIGSIDVNDRLEIFLDEIDDRAKTLVSVYDIKGNRIRSLAKKQIDTKNRESYLKKSQYHIKVDKEGNIYLLFYLLRKLAKYDKEGQLLWERDIKNEILDKYPKDDDLRLGQDTISISARVYRIEITSRGSVLVSHASGGSVFNPNGELIKLIGFEEPNSLFLIRMRADKLVNITSFGEYIFIYNVAI